MFKIIFIRIAHFLCLIYVLILFLLCIIILVSVTFLGFYDLQNIPTILKNILTIILFSGLPITIITSISVLLDK